LGPNDLTTLQSASSRASYTGVLPSSGTSAASVAVACTVEDSLGAATTVTQSVSIAPPALALSNPDQFLSTQIAAVQASLGQNDGAVPGGASLTRSLLSLLQCTATLNDPSATLSQKVRG
jgi:hypothetical protein